MIQKRRIEIFEQYYSGLKEWASENNIQLPFIPDYATNNGHMFYIICNSPEQRDEIISTLRQNDILSVFHYLSLHKSDYYKGNYSGDELQNSDSYTSNLIRLPLYYELSSDDLVKITAILRNII